MTKDTVGLTAYVVPILLTLFCGSTVKANELDLDGVSQQSCLPSAFLTEVNATLTGTNTVRQLEALYKKATNEAQQAEIELTLARVYGQRTGVLNYTNALEWYDKVMVRELPLRTLVNHFLLRGNCHEIIKQREEALSDYIRGMLTILHFNLPEKWPDLQGTGTFKAPPILNIHGPEEGQLAALRAENRRQYADYRRDSTLTRQEQELMMSRYYYIDAIKRVLKDANLTETNLRERVEKLTNRGDRVEDLLRQVRAPNPRPWP